MTVSAEQGASLWRSTIRATLVDNAFILIVPGVIAAGLSDPFFWWSMGVSLVIAFVATVQVNRWLIARGRGPAVVHELHAH